LKSGNACRREKGASNGGEKGSRDRGLEQKTKSMKAGTLVPREERGGGKGSQGRARKRKEENC